MVSGEIPKTEMTSSKILIEDQTTPLNQEKVRFQAPFCNILRWVSKKASNSTWIMQELKRTEFHSQSPQWMDW